MLFNPEEQSVFKTNPALYIEKAIKEYVKFSPNNRLTLLGNDTIWDEPLVGFADGCDPLFKDYKTIIGDFYVTPVEALQMSLKASGYATKVDLSNVSVISWILPATQKTRLSNRKKTDICSLEWNHSRFQGQEFIFRLSRYVVVLLENFGYTAIVPELAPWREMVNLPNGLSSRWSERHAAYAAGLGTFSLSDGFITPKGISIRVGSVVCNLAIPPSPKPYANHLSNCLFYSEGTCGKCIQRCPAGALSEKGHDKIKCAKILTAMRESVSEKPDSDGYIGSGYLGCGLCQTKVPCEDRIPVTKTKNSK